MFLQKPLLDVSNLTKLVLPNNINTMATPQGTFYEELGRRVASARDRKGLTQQKLADILGLSRTSITNIEKGRQPVDVHILVGITDALEVGIAKLIPEHGLLKDTNSLEGLEKYGAAERRFVESILGVKSSPKKGTK